MCPSFLFLSYLLNVSAITQPVISQSVMMRDMQPLAKEEGALTMWELQNREASTLTSCTLWVSVIMHWTDYEQGMLLVLKGGKTAFFSLIFAIVPYLEHDIKPDCHSKPKQIWELETVCTYTSTKEQLPVWSLLKDLLAGRADVCCICAAILNIHFAFITETNCKVN